MMQLGELIGICSTQMNNHEHILSCAWKDHRNCHCLKLFNVIPCLSLHPNILFDHHDFDDFMVRRLPKIQRLIWRLDDCG